MSKLTRKTNSELTIDPLGVRDVGSLLFRQVHQSCCVAEPQRSRRLSVARWLGVLTDKPLVDETNCRAAPELVVVPIATPSAQSTRCRERAVMQFPFESRCDCERLSYGRNSLPRSAARASELCQFHTAEEVAAQCMDLFAQNFDPGDFFMIEPSAGRGPFLRLMPRPRLGIDLDPQCAEARKADFLELSPEFLEACAPAGKRIAVIGNPPFGRNSQLAWKFFNRAAKAADVIAFILPMSVRKAGVENRLDDDFHLVAEWVIPDQAFWFQGKRVSVRTVFQIWERRRYRRPLRLIRHSHPHFLFTGAGDKRANLAIQRIGASAGRVFDDPAGKNPSSHHFLYATGAARTILMSLNYMEMARNCVSIPSLSQAEIVELYSAALLNNGGQRMT
jgi:predicted RNA methylase